MATVAAEIETKFDVAPDFTLPDLSQFGRVEVDTVALSSTYYDTEALDLLSFRLALRCREGDADTGWHLKVPAAAGRTELRLPLAEGLPEELTVLLRPFARGRDVVPAVRIDVTRQRHRIHDADGRLVAEVVVDDVTATGLGAEARAPRWQEAEVELGDAADDAAMTGLSEVVLAAGARPSTSRSKLARSLRGIGGEGVGTPRTSAGAVLVDYMSRQIDAIVGGYFGIHMEVPTAVHQSRVGCRRLRSTLRTFEFCFDVDRARHLEDELRWYAGTLGEVRDREVMLARLMSAIAELPSDLIVGPVADHIERKLREEIETERQEVLSVHEGQRFADLLAAAVSFRDDPPFTSAAGRPASTLIEGVATVEKKLAKRLARATDAAGSDEDMHRARKSGKRVRYAAEAAEPIADTKPIAKRAEALQELLGEFQDSVVAVDLLKRLATDAFEHGEDSFTYGVLVMEERGRAQRIREQARKGS